MEGLSADATTLLATALVGFLGMSSREGPYVVPVSFADDGARVFIHGGPGRKADLLANDGRVCLTVTSSPELTKGTDPCGDNFRYRCALIFGQARLLEEQAEREGALRALTRKYHPEAAEAPFRAGVLDKTLVYAIEVTEVTLKANPAN